jgi:hypothetical protein
MIQCRYIKKLGSLLGRWGCWIRLDGVSVGKGGIENDCGYILYFVFVDFFWEFIGNDVEGRG